MSEIMSLIVDKTFTKIGKKTTLCLLTLDNGYEIVGTSACVDPSNYNYEIGKEQSEIDALKKFGDIISYLYTEAHHLDKTKSSTQGDEKK